MQRAEKNTPQSVTNARERGAPATVPLAAEQALHSSPRVVSQAQLIARLFGTVQARRAGGVQSGTVVQRVITADDGLEVLEETLKGYEGPGGVALADELVAAYYDPGAAEVDLSDLADALYVLADEEESAWGKFLGDNIDFADVAEEVGRLHEVAPDTSERRETAFEQAQAKQQQENKLKAKLADDEKQELLRSSKQAQQQAVLGALPIYVEGSNAVLADVLRRGLANCNGVPTTINSGLTKSGEDLKALKRAWRQLGSGVTAVVINGVALDRVEMWSPGTEAEVGKPKFRGQLVEHTVNFMFKIGYKEGGFAEFNIHVEVAKGDWLD